MPRMSGPLAGLAMGLINLLFKLSGRPLVLLTTVGARSGIEHTVPLGVFPGGEHSWLIVASAGGAARHPAWYFNLAKNPDKVWAQIEGKKYKVRPESLKGAERAEAWQQVIKAAPNYAPYQQKTDREIPIIRLTAE